jgi:hypothetical protein
MLGAPHPLRGEKRSSTVFSKHADEHRPERPVLLEVDQELTGLRRLRVISLVRTGAMPEGTAVQTPAPFQPRSRCPAGDPPERSCYPGDPRERSCYPAGDPGERSCYSSPCGPRCRHAWEAGNPNRRRLRAAARHHSVHGSDDHDRWTDRASAHVGRRARPRSSRDHGRVFASCGTQQRPDAAPRAPRLAQGRRHAPDVRACAVRSASPGGSR